MAARRLRAAPRPTERLIESCADSGVYKIVELEHVPRIVTNFSSTLRLRHCDDWSSVGRAGGGTRGIGPGLPVAAQLRINASRNALSSISTVRPSRVDVVSANREQLRHLTCLGPPRELFVTALPCPKPDLRQLG
jgi:hypothetical protein